MCSTRLDVEVVGELRSERPNDGLVVLFVGPILKAIGPIVQAVRLVVQAIGLLVAILVGDVLGDLVLAATRVVSRQDRAPTVPCDQPGVHRLDDRTDACGHTVGRGGSRRHDWCTRWVWPELPCRAFFVNRFAP